MADEPTVCDFAGHDFADAGGGMEICTECQAERWTRSEDHRVFRGVGELERTGYTERGSDV